MRGKKPWYIQRVTRRAIRNESVRATRSVNKDRVQHHAATQTNQASSMNRRAASDRLRRPSATLLPADRSAVDLVNAGLVSRPTSARDDDGRRTDGGCAVVTWFVGNRVRMWHFLRLVDQSERCIVHIVFP